ncbi:MAG: hypothetical protein WC661_03875 [Opitutaceae bacterium]|jgi:hypothetical protein
MKTPILFFKTGLFLAASVLSLNAAPILSEPFDKLPASEKWKADASVTVADGSLVLTASGMNTGYANSVFVMKAGDPRLDFTAKPLEIELRDVAVGGTAAPGDSVMVMIFSANSPGEGNSSSYLKLRLSDNGNLLLMCGAVGTKEATIHTLATKLTPPLKNLKLRFSATDFSIKGTDAAQEFSGAGKWTEAFNVAAWTGASPYLMFRSVRRPGEGQSEVKIGALTVTNVP